MFQDHDPNSIELALAGAAETLRKHGILTWIQLKSIQAFSAAK